jgi:hypothetical protein
MKKITSFGTILALLWGVTKFWPTGKESEGRVEVRVNARLRRARRPREKARKPADARSVHPGARQQPNRIQEVPAGV